MKKIIAGIVGLIGAALLACPILFKLNNEKSFTIIKGSSGPTSIFIAGKMGKGFFAGTILTGIALIVVMLAMLKKK